MTEITRHHVAAQLQWHIGHHYGISAKALAQKLDITDRRLRRFISELREEGVAICGTPETGYYIAETREELEQCCAFLRSRAMHSLVIEAKLRQIPLADLVGQLKLPT